MLELVNGSPPRGEDFFDQEELIETIWSYLKKDNVLLTAPRRFGKTGAMYKLFDEPRHGFIPIYIDVESIDSTSEFMVELIARLIKDSHFRQIATTIWTETRKFGKFLRNLPAKIEIGTLKVEIRENTDIQKKWLDYGEHLKSLLSKEENPLLLIIDEFPIMVNNLLQDKKNREEAKKFLRWFRSIRIAPGTKARFVIGGSINLISTLDHYGLVDTVNEIPMVKLKPFTREVAERFIAEIFAGQDLAVTDEVKETILNLVGIPIPYILSVLLTAILNNARIKKCEVTPDIVKEAFEDDLLTGSTSVVFQHYRSRIDQYPYYSKLEARAAKEILGDLSRTDKPIKKETLYQVFLKTANLSPNTQSKEAFLQLMNKLDNDFYITSTDDTYAFYSRVLKVWWQTHYGWYGQADADNPDDA